MSSEGGAEAPLVTLGPGENPGIVQIDRDKPVVNVLSMSLTRVWNMVRALIRTKGWTRYS